MIDLLNIIKINSYIDLCFRKYSYSVSVSIGYDISHVSR